MALVTQRGDGTEVVKGDTVTDFRGNTTRFMSATRPRIPGKSGKVVVSDTPDDPFSGREYYDKVFDLTVTEV